MPFYSIKTIDSLSLEILPNDSILVFANPIVIDQFAGAKRPASSPDSPASFSPFNTSNNPGL